MRIDKQTADDIYIVLIVIALLAIAAFIIIIAHNGIRS